LLWFVFARAHKRMCLQAAVGWVHTRIYLYILSFLLKSYVGLVVVYSW